MPPDRQPHLHPPSLSGEPVPRVSYVFSSEAAPEVIWRVRRVALDEALAQPYELTLDLLTDDAQIDPDTLLATTCELSIEREGLVRTVCGIVSRVELHDRLEDQLPVRLVVVPALRLLEQRLDTRLWQSMSAVAIAVEVLGAGLADYQREVDTSGLRTSYATREYVVQYHESDLDFAARLLEDEGVAYHFDHERGTGREIMVLEDSADHWLELPTLDDNPTLAIIATREDQAELESVQRLTWAQALRPTAVVRQTFDWLTPTTPSSTRVASDDDGPLNRSRYHHGRIIEADPEPRVVRELAHARAGAQILRGASNAIGLAPGRRFRVAAPDRAELDHEFLVVSSRVRGDCPEAQLGEVAGDSDYLNEFDCIVATGDPWHPPPCTPKPTIHGPQTALVTGPEGEEIHTDEFGRVKIRFDWDRQHSLTDDSSMWIRVAQGWAGAGFGVLFTPRVGMEVVVEFIGGDPDRPLVTGCVYNGEASASVTLPDAKTQSSIRSKSSPGGAGYNELRFEDAAGAEEIFVHAQRNLREIVGRNRSTTIGSNRSETIGGDHRQTVRGDQTLVVEGTRTETVTGNETVINDGDRDTSVFGVDQIEVYDLAVTTYRNSLSRSVTGREETRVYGNEDGPGLSRTTVFGDLEFKVDKNAKLHAGDQVEILQNLPFAQAKITLAEGSVEQTAAHDWKATAKDHADLRGACLELEGSECAELRQGAASIRIEHDIITINASKVRIVVGDNQFLLSEDGLCTETNTVEMLALAAISITGATVTID